MPQVEQVVPDAVTTEPQPQADPAQIQQVVTGVQDGLMLLRDALEKSPGILSEDKQALDNIIAQYSGFITQNLGAAPGQSAAPVEAEGPGQVPVNQGAGETKPVL